MRVRLLGRAGVQGAPRRGLPGHPGELEPGDDHDRPGDGRRHLHRADHLADDRADHRARASGCAAADDGRPDGVELRARPRPRGRAHPLRRRVDRRVEEGDRQGRGPREVQGGDDAHRTRLRALGHCARSRPGARRAAGHRLSGRHPAVVHAGRHRRRHRLQQGRVRRDVQARTRALADARAPDRGIAARLERVRDGGGARLQGQLHHRLLDRESGSDGRAYRRLDHRRSGADADRQGIPDHAQRVDRRAARGRRGHRRLERAVRDQPSRRPHDRDRDESRGSRARRRWRRRRPVFRLPRSRPSSRSAIRWTNSRTTSPAAPPRRPSSRRSITSSRRFRASRSRSSGRPTTGSRPR